MFPVVILFCWFVDHKLLQNTTLDLRIFFLFLNRDLPVLDDLLGDKINRRWVIHMFLYSHFLDNICRSNFRIETFWNHFILSFKFLLPCPFFQVPKCFVPVQILWASPKIWLHSKTFLLAQKTILLNAKYLFVWHKMFVTATICK